MGELSQEKMLEALELMAQHPTIRAAAQAIRIPRTTLRDRYAKALQAVADGIIDAPVSEYKPLPGHIISGESALTNAEGKLILKWTKTAQDGSTEALIEALKETFAEYKARAPFIPSPPGTSDQLMTIYPLPDLHFGMRAWAQESGEEYNLELAAEQITSAFEELVSQAPASKHAVLLGLGDYFHADDHTGMTHRSKNILDVADRWNRVYPAGARLAVSLVEIIAKRHETVEVVFLSGNHDENAAMCLTVALSFWYHAMARIGVTATPSRKWYRRFGECLLGAAHGDAVKPADMPMMMAAERHEDWGQSRHRHMFCGHMHREQGRRIAGVMVEALGSPAARDAYAAGRGFSSVRSLCAITFHQSQGPRWRHWVEIKPAQQP